MDGRCQAPKTFSAHTPPDNFLGGVGNVQSPKSTHGGETRSEATAQRNPHLRTHITREERTGYLARWRNPSNRQGTCSITRNIFQAGARGFHAKFVGWIVPPNPTNGRADGKWSLLDRPAFISKTT